MKKETANKLEKKAEQVALNFSNHNRPLNNNNETFKVDKINPLSESTAFIVFHKDNKKFAGAFFYYVNVNGGEWRYFFPTDSHLLGMGLISQAKQLIEFANFGFNFSE